jgi:hypothetical protein
MESTRQSIVIAQVIGNYQVLAQLGSGGMAFHGADRHAHAEDDS